MGPSFLPLSFSGGGGGGGCIPSGNFHPFKFYLLSPGRGRGRSPCRRLPLLARSVSRLSQTVGDDVECQGDAERRQRLCPISIGLPASLALSLASGTPHSSLFRCGRDGGDEYAFSRPRPRSPAFLFGHFYRKFRAERKNEISSMADFTLSIVFGGHRNMSILLTLALPLHTASFMTAVCPSRGYVVRSRLAASPSSSPSSHPTPRPRLRGPHDSYARKETGQTGERGESTFNAEERERKLGSPGRMGRSGAFCIDGRIIRAAISPLVFLI